ncbi:hypothetical protein [Bacillus sp. LL01]|uniref:hypothetical protein n=1 Tax=Bacillus sp. LL01 TaxID=1665556 RepID=UPI0018E36D96|nr:hypothetical protein [Bacillus sp. LL01]
MKKNFSFFFLADIISGFGVGMATIGANWFLMEETGSLSAVGIMLSLNVISGFLVSPFTGTNTDTFTVKWLFRQLFY